MNKATNWILILFFLLIPLCIEGKNRVVLNPNSNIKQQLREDNTTFVVKQIIDLQGETVSIPNNSVLLFKRKGLIQNGCVKGVNTTLKGRVKLGCELSGTFLNDEIPVSWLCATDRETLAKQIASVFNLNKICVLKLDEDIDLDGSHKKVGFVAFSGSKTVRNCCSYKVSGDVILHNVSFADFESHRELFLNLQGITKPVSIEISNIRFDGNWNISRFIYCPYIELDNPCTLNVISSEFTRVRNFVIQFRSPCTGEIRNNRIENIGTDKFSNVIGFHLGDTSKDAERHCARDFVITNNIFRDFKVPYNDKDDGREVHAILIYGHRNLVRENQVIHFYPLQDANGDIGRDGEGIYLKGEENVVENNYLENCVGSGPDGAITIKSSYSNNRISGNTVKHQYGIGVQCYTPNSVVENNKVYSEQNAVAGMAMVFNTGSTIRNNEFFASLRKEYHAAIALTRCEGITITDNRFNNTSGVLTTYKSKGQIHFEGNEVNLSGMVYGTNTYYSSPFELHDDTAEYVMNNNTFTMKGVRTSQLVEAPEGFKGKVILSGNDIHLEDSGEVHSAMTYLVRNVRSLTVNQNTEQTRGKIIGKISNLEYNVKK